MMHTVDFSAGEHIAKAAALLVAAAQEHGSAKGSFNDIEITAEAGTTVDEVLERWSRDNEARHQAYLASPEGIAAERERNETRAALQQQHDALMLSLPALDMGNDVAVLDWLLAMQQASDHIGVIVRRDTIVRWFEKHGYGAEENCEEAFRSEDRKNVFRYLVGQALDGLKRASHIHPIIQKFAAEWKAKFISPTKH